MMANARLTDALVRRGLAPSFSQDNSPVVRDASSDTSVVRMRKPRSMTSPTPRLDGSLIVRRHAVQTVREAQEETRTETARKAAMEAFALEVRQQNAEFERDARIGYVDPESMEPWQRRRRFGK